MMPWSESPMRSRSSSAEPGWPFGASESMRFTVRAHVGRVERREHEVARLGGLERDVHRDLVADFADEDHVGVLAQRGAERVGEGRRVDADLALADARLVVGVEELDRILDGDDVERLRRVQVRDHRGERGALAVARGADDEHEPAIALGEVLRGRRRAELLEGRDVCSGMARMTMASVPFCR